MSLFSELRRRNVFRVGAAYFLFAWIVIQVTSTVAPVLRLPDWTMAFVLWICVIGFPFALFLAWAFEVTPEGVKLEKNVDRARSITAKTGHRLNYIVIALLGTAVILLVADKYLLSKGDERLVAGAPPAGTAADHRGYASIGVLPFVNMSDDPSQEYFSDGIAEELLNSLAKLHNLHVAARTSSFVFKGQNADITAIGNSLNVDTVLEGSVRKAGNRVRITAQLIDVANGYHLWSETYDRELTDIFAIQDEITAAIVDALVVHLEMGEAPASKQSTVKSMSAYDAYLQALHLARSPDADAGREALRLFRSATEADPEFAAAWAGRASAVLALRQTDFRDGIPSEEAFLLAENSIDRALALDPNLAEAYLAQGLLYGDRYRYEDALASIDKAVAINPNLADAWTWRSRLLARFGRIRESRESMLTSLNLDPHNELTAVLAANLVSDFYDAGFAAQVKRFVGHSARARRMLEYTERVEVQPLNREVFDYALSLADNDTDRARVDLSLKRINEPVLTAASRNRGEFLMWLYMGIDRWWDKARAMYDALPPSRQQSILNLEELSIMLASQGRCEESLQTIGKAHGGEVRIHGEVGPNIGRSNSNLALNQVFCLRRLGRNDEADSILGEVRRYVGTLRANTIYGIYMVDAKLRVLDGDIDGALEVLEAAYDRHELGWNDPQDPILRTLAGEPRFKAIYARVDANIDELRAELGWPPAEF